MTDGVALPETEPIRFGLVGVDSSHALQFTRLFGDGRSGRVRGGTVTAAWRGPASADLPPSRDRNDANAAALEALGVPLSASLEQVAERSDAVLLVSADARTRRAQFERLAPFGKPVYVDTRFATSARDAVEMLALADERGCLVLSGSPKRFTPEFRSLRAQCPSVDALDLRGPLVEQPGHPGLAWYGVHLVDLAVAMLGTVCVRVEPVDGGVRLLWADGRAARLAGPAEWSPWTTGIARTPSGVRRFEIEAEEEMLVGVLEAIVRSCRSSRPNIAYDEIVAICAITETGTRAMHLGRPLDVPAPDRPSLAPPLQ